jgi:hypothetical protein
MTDKKPLDLVQIPDLDTFTTLLSNWHKTKVAMLEHMLNLPDGSEMVVNGDDEAPVVMTGDMLAGYKYGIQLSLMELGTLPFIIETVDQPLEADAG